MSSVYQEIEEALQVKRSELYQRIEDTIKRGCSNCGLCLVVFDAHPKINKWVALNHYTTVFNSNTEFVGAYCDNCNCKLFNQPAWCYEI